MRLRDLLYYACIASSGEACRIISEHVSDSAGAFTALMNAEAASLGCDNSHFTNADGTADPDQYTTAWDQYLILREAVKHTLFLEIAGTLKYKTVSSSVYPGRIIDNTNRMLYGNSAVFNKYCVAGKADASSDNKSSFISCAKSGNRTLICVIFYAAGADAEGKPAEGRSYYEAKSLIEWGFTSFAWYTVLNKDDVVARENVKLASGTDSVELQPQETITILTRADLAPGDIKREVILYGKDAGKTVTAPVKAGDILGQITVTIDGVVRGRTNLVAARDIRLNTVEFLKLRVTSTLSDFWVQCGVGVLVLLIIGYIVLISINGKARRKKRREIEAIKKSLIDDRRRIHK